MGELSFNLETMGVRQEDFGSLERTIRARNDLIRSTIRIEKGMLTCTVARGQLNDVNYVEQIHEVHFKIKGQIEHKSNTPGRGKSRRTSAGNSQKYVNATGNVGAH